MSQFGRILLRGQVSAAITATLTTWMPTYLGEVERVAERHPGTYLATWRAGAIVQVSEVGKMTEDSLPAIAVVAPKVKSVEPQQGGVYTYTWNVTLVPIVSARDEAATNELLDAYAAAIRSVLLQKRSLGGFANGTRPAGNYEDYAGLPLNDARTIQLATLDFEIDVDNAAQVGGGPAVPVDPGTVDPGDWPTITSTESTVEIIDEDN